MHAIKFDRAKLDELRAVGLPHLRAADIVNPIENSAEQKKQWDMIDAYVKAFTPMQDNKCICCGEPQGARNLADVVLGTARFKWGLAHGEGRCSECGYPARAIHYIGKGDDEIVMRNVLLQYHPDGLSFDPPETEVTATAKQETA